MQNFDIYKKVKEELESGMHFQSMEQENAQYVDSIAGKLNKLKETWVSVFNTIFSSDATKGILDGLITISEAIAKVVESLDEVGMLTPILGSLGATIGIKMLSGVNSFIKLSKGMNKEIKDVGDIANSTINILGTFGQAGAKAGTTMAGTAGKIGTVALSISKFIPYVAVGTAAIGGLMWVIERFTESLDEEKQRLNDTINTRKEEISSIEEQKGRLQELQEEYDTLANKPSKTNEELKRMEELTKRIAEIRPDLVVGTDSSGNPILSMTGDVKDLIKEMDRAVESKKRLLSVEQNDLAKNSIKQLHGSIQGYDPTTGLALNADSEMYKLEQLTKDHLSVMGGLEKKRDEILNKLYGTTGKERQKILKDLEKANYNIEKEQMDFTKKYQQQLDIVKEYSSKIGEGVFASLENSNIFKGMDTELQEKFSNLKNSLDFSDIKTEDELLDVEMALSNLMKAAKNGEVNLDEISKSLEKANNEFAKTGNAKAYGEAIDEIIAGLEEATGKDFSMLKDVFEGVDTSILKGKDALDEFLRAYGKTKEDLNNNDGFAKSLANQKRQIEQAIDELNNVTGDAKIDLKLAYDIVNNNELPMELRDMVRVLLNKGYNSTEVVNFTQELLVDISDGKINIEEANNKIKEKFGEGAFEITPNILLSENAKVAGVERVIEQLNEKFGEIPPVVKTIIETDGVTAYNSAKEILETYNNIPEEIRTTMSNNGLETLGDIINIQNMLDLLPKDVVMNIATNFPDIVNEAGSVQEIVNSLPASVLLEIQSNYPEVVEKSQLLQDAINKIPASKESVVSVKEEVQKSPSSIFDKLFGKGKNAMTTTAVINTQVNNSQALTNVEEQINRLTTNGKAVNVKADTSDISSKVSDTQNKVDSIKQKAPTKVSVDNISANNRLKTTKGHLDDIKDKSVTVTVNTNYTTTGKPSPASNTGNGGGHTFGLQPSSEDIVRTYNVSNEVVDTTDTNDITTFSNETPLNTMSRATIKTPIEVTGSSVSSSIKYNVDLLKELENRIKSVGNQLSILDKKMKHATGEEKIRYLKEQNELYKEQLQHQKELESAFNKQQAHYKNFLSSKGFQFTSDGNLKNYEEKLIAMEKEAERLEEIANKEKASDGQKKASENYKKNLDEIKKYLNEYIKVSYEELPGVADKFIDINNAIKDNINSIKEFEKEIAELKDDSKHKNENRDIWEVENKLDKNEALLKTAVGKEEIKLLGEQISLYKELKKEKQDLLKVENETREELISKLGEYGFTFRDDGSIEKYGQKIEKLKNTLTKDEFDDVYSMVEDYLDSTYKKIPDLENEIIGIGDSIRKAQNELDYAPVEDIDKEIERADEKELLGLLKKKLELLQQVADKKKEYIELLQQESNKTKEELEKSGISFNDDGSVKDYDETVKSLQESLKKLTGDSAKEIEKILVNLETYVKTTESEIPKAIEEWKDAQHQIKETGEEIKDVEDKQNKFLKDRANALRKATEDIMKVTQELLQTQMNINKKHIDIIEKSMELSSFNPKETFETLEKQISLLEKQQELQGQLNKELEKQKEYYKDRLIGFGIKFDEKGIATNVEDILDKIKSQMANASDSDELDALEEKFNDIVGVLDDYNGALENIVDSQADLVDIQLEIEDVYKNMLETTKKIEDKITAIIEKQIEERKKLINDELNKRLDAIKKVTYSLVYRVIGIGHRFNCR